MPRKPRIDLTGQRIGRLTVLEIAGRNIKRQWWRCLCDCGNETRVEHGALLTQHTKSCGCLVAEVAKTYNTKHGRARTPLYNVWTNIKSRCNNPNVEAYPRYGGRGIKMHPVWDADFDAFAKYMGPPPTPLHTIDRIDNDKGYEPGNCRWATRSEQSRNRRPFSLKSSLRIPYNGSDYTVRQLSKLLGIPQATLYKRFANGRPIDAPVNKKLSTSVHRAASGQSRRRSRE